MCFVVDFCLSNFVICFLTAVDTVPANMFEMEMMRTTEMKAPIPVRGINQTAQNAEEAIAAADTIDLKLILHR